MTSFWTPGNKKKNAKKTSFYSSDSGSESGSESGITVLLVALLVLYFKCACVINTMTSQNHSPLCGRGIVVKFMESNLKDLIGSIAKFKFY